MSGLWTAIGGIVGLIVLVVWALTIVDIFRSDLSGGRRAAWVIVTLLLPLVASELYWALREPSWAEVQYQADAERALRESARRRPFDSTGVGERGGRARSRVRAAGHRWRAHVPSGGLARSGGGSAAITQTF